MLIFTLKSQGSNQLKEPLLLFRKRKLENATYVNS